MVTHPLSFVGAEETSVVAFLHHYVGDTGPVVLLQADAGLPDGNELWPSNLMKNISAASSQELLVRFVKSLSLVLSNIQYHTPENMQPLAVTNN